MREPFASEREPRPLARRVTARVPGRLLVVVGLAIGVRLLNLSQIAGLPVARYQFEWTEADMNFHYAWSEHIKAGDLTSREVRHPFTSWMEELAPRETWERWRGGRHAFFKSPLYPYVLAGIRSLLGDGFWPIALGQMVIGLASVSLIFLLAGRFFGPDAATAAGVCAALYGPSLLLEALLLRDGLAAFTSLLLLSALPHAEDERPWRWLVSGLPFALALLARETTLLFAPFIVFFILQRFRGRWGAIGKVTGAFAVGVILGLLPLFARNLAVGVQPWLLSSLAIEGIVYGHAADSLPMEFSIPPSARSILLQADGRLAEAVRLTWATYHGDWWRLLANEGAKVAAVFASYEPADNVNWYYFRDRLPLLRLALPFQAVLALGLLGLWVERRSATRHRILWYFLIATLAGLMYAPVIGRYRLTLAAVLLVYAGAVLAWLGRRLRARQWSAVVPVGLAAVAILVVSSNLHGSYARRHRYRGAEFILAGEAYYRRHERERAFEELRDGLRSAHRGPDQPELPADYLPLAQNLVVLAREMDREGDAALELRRLARDYPEDQTLRTLLALVEGR